MAKASFGIIYDGVALETGEMPVRELAPALLALGELFTEASMSLYPNREPVSLNIRATGEGSFWVQLVATTKQAWDDSVDIWGSEPAAALANLLAAIYGGNGLFNLIKKLRGRRPDEPSSPSDAGSIGITLPDGTTLDIPREVWQLYVNPSIRRKARDVVGPLQHEGIDTVEFREERHAEPELVIEKNDLPSFSAAAASTEEEPLTENERVTVVEIVSLSYVPNRQWRLREGAAAFGAYIEDAEFWDRVHSREIAFAEGDLLRVRIRVIQSIDVATGRLHAHYIVVRVLDLIPPGNLP